MSTATRWPSCRTRSAPPGAISSRSACASRHAATASDSSLLTAAAASSDRNVDGNALAIMPHPERAAWRYQQPERVRFQARGDRERFIAPYGGSRLFELFAQVFAT